MLGMHQGAQCCPGSAQCHPFESIRAEPRAGRENSLCCSGLREHSCRERSSMAVCKVPWNHRGPILVGLQQLWG